MTDTPPPPAPRRAQTGGGFLIAAGLIGGAIVGTIFHQPTIGLLAGFAIGVIGAVAMAVRS